ncbi:energy-coupling factor ABC transporter ATP-binding protein [Paenibacillus solisilvae]|uniref:Energy-coupling factor ABC transporter ATP-binding protein n=1 Tax=Paenibacillus solisilvae TaxID=2486751 RepID=A0ABW0W0P9_9BACL
MSRFEISRLSVSGASGEENESSPARLKDIDLNLSPGEWVTVVGVNGSGKTTLARILAGLTVEGATGFINRGFAGSRPAPYVMQQPDAQLFGETPREEIIFALEWLQYPAESITDKADSVLEMTGLMPVADFPWERLSGGQRQLAAIAAATAGEVPLLVFDEATSMLDDESRLRVHGMASELQKRGTAVVWVTQRLDELERSSRIVALTDGKIVFDGRSEHFLYGDLPSGNLADLPKETPCEECGLRLPYLASLAIEMYRNGQLQPPFPVSMAEWRKALDLDD